MYNFKCVCNGNEQGGDYSRMSVFEHNGDIIQVDSCMVGEIKYLLEQGVKTIASCCGHRTGDGWIIVGDVESVNIMTLLKYNIDNTFKDNGSQLVCFTSKTNHDEPVVVDNNSDFLHKQNIMSMVKFENTNESVLNIEKFIGHSFPILNNDYGNKVAIMFDEKLLLLEGDYLARLSDGTFSILSRQVVECEYYE